MNKKRWLVIIVIVAAAVLLSILFDTMLANHRPAITSLEAPERVLPSGSCQIICTASDRDGDELSYNWSASGGNISGTGASVNWAAPDSVGSYNVTVWVTDDRGGEVMSQLTITVRANWPPTITSLVADAVWTTLSGSLQVTCTASDPDGDELSYEWSATGGDISNTGAVVNWTAPEEVGIYNVTVVVTDGHGSSATDSLPISVATEQPPIIEALLVTAEHCYLKEEGSGYKVGKGQKYDIECIVSDTSVELFYEWSCDGGELSGDDSLITWTAPNMSGYVTVTVIASDIADNRMRKSIILNVVSCSPCTFGC
ncbi:MAG: Ig-like domain-containing protein [Dehalococcoidia bacterium]